jgi:DNA-binding GntR family transcriptional regulator
MEEWYETRTALEGYAVMRACSHITAAQLGELQRLCDEMAAVIRSVRELPDKIANTKLRERFLALDLEFHMLVLHVSGNAWMLRIVEDCKLLTKFFGHQQIEHDMHLLSRGHLGRLRIVQALRRQQPELARRLMEEHIQAACRAVLAGYAAKRGAPDEAV